MVVGSDDRLTPPPLTFAFEHSLKANGNEVQVLVLKNLGHEIFLEPAVLQQLINLMNVSVDPLTLLPAAWRQGRSSLAPLIVELLQDCRDILSFPRP
jgi:acetyl esterase/lipase